MKQRIITADNHYRELDQWVEKNGAKRILLVCDDSIQYHKELNAHLRQIENMGVELIRFCGFRPNPLYDSAAGGAKLFRDKGCGAIMAVGGGSAIDVAKCIKLFSNMDTAKNCLKQEIVPNSIPFLAMPTTAGTGSEATQYAVIYFNGAKQTVTHESCIPETILLDPGALKTLPAYQKKATMMDALCHGIESFWSVNSTEESREYSRAAIAGVMEHMDGYLANYDEGNAGMLTAANAAGKAINIAQTTAGHGMRYKITSLFGCAHGHAAILCDRVLFPWMIKNTDKCIDPRGESYLKETLSDIAKAMGCPNAIEGARKLQKIFDDLKLEIPAATELQLEELKGSINTVRFKNHPIKLDGEAIDMLYRRALRDFA